MYSFSLELRDENALWRKDAAEIAEASYHGVQHQIMFKWTSQRGHQIALVNGRKMMN
jgi:hypothetical protein